MGKDRRKLRAKKDKTRPQKPKPLPKAPRRSLGVATSSIIFYPITVATYSAFTHSFSLASSAMLHSYQFGDPQPSYRHG